MIKEVTCLSHTAESREARTGAQVSDSGAIKVPTPIGQADFSASSPSKGKGRGMSSALPPSARSCCLLESSIVILGLKLVKDASWKVTSSYRLVFAKEVDVGSLEGGIKNKTERSP